MIEHHRQSVPALQQKMNGKALVYCDWAATAQMPQCVLDVVSESMQLRGNVRRGVHNLGAESTRRLEQARGSTHRRRPAHALQIRGASVHGRWLADRPGFN